MPSRRLRGGNRIQTTPTTEAGTRTNIVQWYCNILLDAGRGNALAERHQFYSRKLQGDGGCKCGCKCDCPEQSPLSGLHMELALDCNTRSSGYMV